MTKRRLAVAGPLLFIALILSASSLGQTSAAPSDLTPTAYAYLPIVIRQPTPTSVCPTISTNQYTGGTAFQFDMDDPVRPADNHADKNLALRSYELNTDPDLQRELVTYGPGEPEQPPQFATLFNPYRVPGLSSFHRVHAWLWESSPDPGTCTGTIQIPPVTALGMQTTPGETLHVPTSYFDIGGGMEVIVLFADQDSITLRYAREDSAGSAGYTLHVDNICTDPNLLALYNTLDDPDGPRYVYVPPESRPYSYLLPNLAAGQPFGTARDSEIVVAIVDTGAFLDPRGCNEWWEERPGYAGTCPPAR